VTADSPLVAESLRLNARYIEEVVIGWGLCPWAAQAWREGAVARRVLVEPAPESASGQAPAIGGVLAFIDEIASNPAISIGLAIFPRATLSEAAWGTFAERVRRADRARRAPQEQAPFLLAAFHPGSARAGGAAVVTAAVANSGALVSFIRRAPDPMLQLVRTSLLEGLARDGRDLSGEIARANFAAVNARTAAALDALVGEIRSDRDATYARLGLV
jgi:hypothetical protein